MLKKKKHSQHHHAQSGHSNKPSAHPHSTHHKKVRKKRSILHKLSFAIILFSSLILAYFIILVSAEPKSFPYVTTKIEEYLEKNFSSDVEIENTTITFTAYGSFRIKIKNLKINKKYIAVSGENREFIIPQMEMEFSLIRLLFFDLTPYKIKIVDPEIVIGGFYSLQENVSNSVSESSPLVDLFKAIKDEKLKIKVVVIENVKLVLKQDKIVTKEIIIRKSEVKIKSASILNGNKLKISSSNIINLDKSQKDIFFNSNCILSDHSLSNCDIAASNIETATIANLNPNLKILEKIKTSLNITATLQVNEKNIQTINFRAQAKNGVANLEEFFSKKIVFSNLIANGDYNSDLDTLNLSEIKADLLDTGSQDIKDQNAKISMSVLLSDLTNTQNNKSDFYIRIENVGKGGLEQLWPTFLPGQHIREWVVAHIYDERIKDAFTKFTLKRNAGVFSLEKLDSKVAFENLNIKYDNYFPKITAAKGVAIFTKHGMNILINDANVLESRISNAQVSIDDFAADKIILNIKGNLAGKAGDGLKHANYDSKFAYEVGKYLNGESFGDFDVRLPLHSEISLKTIYIAANLDVKALKNEYINGDIKISTKKNYNDTNFVSSIDLTNANLTAKIFDVEKKNGDNGNLTFILNIKNNNLLQFKNFVLTKQEKNYNKEKVVNAPTDSKIAADFEIQTAPLKIVSLNVENENFGKNNYNLAYLNKNNSQKISVRGQYLNLGTFLENKSKSNDKTISKSESNSLFSENLSARISLGKVFMAKDRSINKFYLAINRRNKFYQHIFITGNQGGRKLINLSTNSTNQKYPIISGNINDVGYLAEAFNISDTVSGGQAKIAINQSFLENNLLLKGNIEIDNDITFYETNHVKLLEKDTLFIKVKDKIFSNNKTTFTKLKLEFNAIDDKVEIESFLANNFKIGITAKGFFNIANNSYEIKGMIIPGFVVNNLFGIGNIPLIGGVISGLLTGGEGGGLFGIKYVYKKDVNEKEPTFKTDVVSAFVPVSIRNLFDSI